MGKNRVQRQRTIIEIRNSRGKKYIIFGEKIRRHTKMTIFNMKMKDKTKSKIHECFFFS